MTANVIIVAMFVDDYGNAIVPSQLNYIQFLSRSYSYKN
jgi:hypothetical protein